MRDLLGLLVPARAVARHDAAVDRVDVAFEAAGIATVAEQAFRATRTGDKTVLIGQPALGVRASFPVYELTQFEHDVLGTHIGGAVPALDIPAIARLLQVGLLDLSTLVTHRFRLDEIGEAVTVAASGSAGRVVLDTGNAPREGANVRLVRNQDGGDP